MLKQLYGFSPAGAENSGRMRTVVLLCMALFVITLAVYIPVGNHEFINYDDDFYVVANPHVASGITGKNIAWAFTTMHQSNWHPITWLSHMADAQFYGMAPRGHHLTNVFIHAASTLLLFLLLLRITGAVWQSSFVAALFALHPLHVESVAWVAERKDILSAFFWFLTLLFYSEYAAQRKKSLYLLTLITFVLGLMSKPMLVTLPVIMLLIDFWPLDRYRHEEQEQGLRQLLPRVITVVKEKIPFFACTLLSSVITIYAQGKGGAISNLETVSFWVRIENALISYVKYITKALWPVDLGVLYPIQFSFPLWQVIGALLVLLLFSVIAVMSGRRHPYLPVGWFWFLVALLPVIGLIQVGAQSMADRYTYIPLTGLFILVAWGVPDLIKGLQYRVGILALLGGAVIAASAALTWQQLGYWRDSVALYRHTLQVTSGNCIIHYNLGNAFLNKEKPEEAIPEFREAIRINPNFAVAYRNLGLALYKKGNLDAAIYELEKALRINPGDADAHRNVGLVYLKKGFLDPAIRSYQAALRINPDLADAHRNLGIALFSKGNLQAAVSELQAALRLNPNDSRTNNILNEIKAFRRSQGENPK